ncbi:uncharacterized protein [Euwallacea fornicatus]|uniref:uncharacterized protein isoform X1 n=1 Tax=Euwallacea fornicatus TaxID=995702 RepID=UPI00338FE6E8
MFGGRSHYSSLILTTLLIIVRLSKCGDTTSKYLENAVRGLRNLRQFQTFSTTEVNEPLKQQGNSKIHRRSYQRAEGVPPLQLTKGELAAIYEQALIKGDTVKLDTGDSGLVQALVHHIDEEEPTETPNVANYKHHDHDPPADPHPNHEAVSEDSGYYYYYYPIKTFTDEITSQPSDDHYGSHHLQHYHHSKETSTYKPPYTYHSHHHQHNITIQHPEDKKEMKPMEHPLFMAISGFLGMAVMYVVMSLLPKLGSISKPKVGNGVKKKEQLDDFARFALNAIEGNCAERFACELTKTARSFELEENRFYKLLKRVAPGTFGRYIKNSAKYANKQLQCTAIPCRKKRPNATNPTRKPSNKNQNKKTTVNKRF